MWSAIHFGEATVCLFVTLCQPYGRVPLLLPQAVAGRPVLATPRRVLVVRGPHVQLRAARLHLDPRSSLARRQRRRHRVARAGYARQQGTSSVTSLATTRYVSMTSLATTRYVSVTSPQTRGTTRYVIGDVTADTRNN